MCVNNISRSNTLTHAIHVHNDFMDDERSVNNTSGEITCTTISFLIYESHSDTIARVSVVKKSRDVKIAAALRVSVSTLTSARHTSLPAPKGLVRTHIGCHRSRGSCSTKKATVLSSQRTPSFLRLVALHSLTKSRETRFCGPNNFCLQATRRFARMC